MPENTWLQAAEKAIKDSRDPSPALRAAAKAIHDKAVRDGSYGPHYKKTYEELQSTDPIGFGEFNDMVARKLAEGASAA